MGVKRGELVWDEFIPWIIGLGVLILGFVLYFILTGKATSALDHLKNIFRFGGA